MSYTSGCIILDNLELAPTTQPPLRLSTTGSSSMGQDNAASTVGLLSSSTLDSMNSQCNSSDSGSQLVLNIYKNSFIKTAIKESDEQQQPTVDPSSQNNAAMQPTATATVLAAAEQKQKHRLSANVTTDMLEVKSCNVSSRALARPLSMVQTNWTTKHGYVNTLLQPHDIAQNSVGRDVWNGMKKYDYKYMT